MKKITILLVVIYSFTLNINAQVGIGTITPESTLDIRSSNQATPANTDGILIPKADAFPIINPTANQDGMLLYLTGNGAPSKGFYYWDNAITTWITVTGINRINDLIDGRSDMDGSENGSSVYLGVDAGLNDDLSNNRNIGIGYQSLMDNINGSNNTAAGYYALRNNTTGSYNTAFGSYSLFSNTVGFNNTALGFYSLRLNNSGSENLAIGTNTMYSNTSGNFNIAIANNSLFYNTSGSNNLALGYSSLFRNTLGVGNIGLNSYSLYNNTFGSFNIAIGRFSLIQNTTGDDNIGLGYQSLENNILGDGSIAIGRDALRLNANGEYNVAIGYNAGYNETGSNKLYIENSNSTSPLIYGEFDNDLLRVNGTLHINNAYQFPIVDGTIGQVLQTDGVGVVTWEDASIIDDDSINNLTDGKSDNDGTNNGSSIFLGVNAGVNDDGSNNRNIGIGWEALTANTTGNDNIAIGNNTLSSNINGFSNIGIGREVLFNNLGNGNVGIGFHTLFNNTTGSDNMSIGFDALFSNTTGVNNNAYGSQSLTANTIGFFNNAFGRHALQSNTTGAGNVAMGHATLADNIVGNDNVAIGGSAGDGVNGNNNVFLGQLAGGNGTTNTNSGNVLIGYRAGQNGVFNNRLYIENSNSTLPLIYGEFDNDLLRVNGTLDINNQYQFPISDGTANQVMLTDGAGVVTWEDASIVDDDRINNLADGKSDNDGTDDGSSIFFGIGAGQNDDSSNNNNVGIGRFSLNGNTSGENNIAIGQFSMAQNTTGNSNTAIGISTLDQNITGRNNTALGYRALTRNNANSNTAIGYQSLFFNSTGYENVAIGNNAMYDNSTGNFNVAIGSYSLADNTTGFYNVAVGRYALSNNTEGISNTAIGVNVLGDNITGTYNSAFGIEALGSSNGNQNVSGGAYSLRLNTTGDNNTALGYSTLSSNTVGINNTGLGTLAGYSNITGNDNVFIGYRSGYYETGSNKLYIENSDGNENNALIYGEFDTNLLRFNADVEVNTGSLNVDAGTLFVDEANNRTGVGTLTPGYRFSVNGTANLNEGIGTGVALRVNGAEALWYNGTYFSYGFGGTSNYFSDNVGIGIGAAATNPNVELVVVGDIEYTGTITDVSDRRLKENFEIINDATERLKQINGYSYNMIDDETKKREYGVIAQDLQKVFPEMVSVVDVEKGYLGVSYIQLIPVLINAVKEQDSRIQELESQLEYYKKIEERILALESNKK